MAEKENIINTDSLILAPNRAMASAIKRQQLQQHKCQAMPSQVFVLDLWLRQQWELLNDSAILGTGDLKATVLSNFQSHLLWERVLNEYGDSLSSCNLRALVTYAHLGWRLLQRAEIDKQRLQQYEQGFPIQFNRWIASFKAALDAGKHCTYEDALSLLRRHFEQQKERGSPFVDTIILCGFLHDLPELYIRVLSAACSKLTYKSLPERPKAKHQAVACDQNLSQITAALEWARHRAATDQNARIGIIISDLNQQRLPLERLLQKVPLEVSIGGTWTLSDHPQITAALLLLQLNQETLSFQECCQQLQSPFWFLSDPSYYGFRVAVEEALYLTKADQLSVADWLKLIARTAHYYLADESRAFDPSCVKKVQQLQSIIKPAASKIQPMWCWFNLFAKQLQQLGWDNSSATELAIDSWMELPKLCLQLDVIIGQCDCKKALAVLRELCQQQHPYTLMDSNRVHIIDTIEGVANFTHIWLCDADNRKWPGPVSSNPLIPIALQKTISSIRCSPQQEQNYCQRLLKHLQLRTPVLVFSFCTQEGDQKITISPLLPHIDTVDVQTLVPSLVDVEPVIEPASLEPVDCSKAPSINAREKQLIKGGSGLVKTLLQCPLTAFVHYRLGAKPLPSAVIGIDPLSRGNLTHWAMERLWQALKGQRPLLELSDSECRSHCDDSIDQAFDLYQRDRFFVSQTLLDLERQRLRNILYKWLEVEKNRPHFDVIACEKKLQFKIEGLPLTLHLDRKDLNEDNQTLLIDYKTGSSVSPANWGNLEKDTVIKEPQLPLYLIAEEDDSIKGIGFVKLNASKQELVGICAKDSWEQSGLKGKSDWDQWLIYWRVSISQAINHFILGHTELTEKQPGGDPFNCVHRWPEYLQSQLDFNSKLD